MNLKALKIFHHVMIEGSLARAAEQVHISQSAASRQLSQFESELNMPLFYRTGHTLTPTPEAITFYNEMQGVIATLHNLPGMVKGIKQKHKRSLRILTIPYIEHSLIYPVVTEFIKKYPDVDVQLMNRSRRDVNEWLDESKYDLGINSILFDFPNFDVEMFLRLRIQAIIPPTHPLVGQDTVTAHDLRDDVLIHLSPGALLRQQSDSFFASAGILPQKTYEVTSALCASSLVVHGVGVTIADSLLAHNSIKPVNQRARAITIPITPEQYISFALITPKNRPHNPYNAIFTEMLKKHLQTIHNAYSHMELFF